MRYKIVSDSAANSLTIEQIPFAQVPLHIIVDDHEFVDDATTNLAHMEDALASCKTSSTACPGMGDWLQAFEDAEYVFCVTLTSTLSGSYASAQMAKQEYEENFPSRHVYIIDSLSAGPEMALILEKLQELLLSDREPEDIYRAIEDYTRHTHLLFSLESLSNLAKNGRISPAAAKLAGLLGIRVVGQASVKGELQPLAKCRGERSAISCIVKQMKELHYCGGRVRIAHNGNEKAARKLARELWHEFPDSNIEIGATGALCSYYAEKGGLMIGLEG